MTLYIVYSHVLFRLPANIVRLFNLDTGHRHQLDRLRQASLQFLNDQV